MGMFVFTSILWKEEKEFSALCPELDVASQGKTHAEAHKIYSKLRRSISKALLKMACPTCVLSQPKKTLAIRFLPRLWKFSNSKWT